MAPVTRARTSVCLILIVLAALAARGLALWAARDAEPVLDEQLYVMRANALLEGEGFLGSFQSWVRHPESPYMVDLPQYPGAYQPPGYVAFMASVMWITGRSVLAVKIAQVLISTLSVLLVYAIGKAWFDRRHGLLAALFAALYPNFIAYSHYLWTETLFIFLILLAVWLLTRGPTGPNVKSAAAAGAVLGLAMLTRAAIVYFLPLLLIWLIVSMRDRWRVGLVSGAALLGAATVVVAPWTVRNYRLHDAFVLIDTNGPFNLWRGNAPSTFRDRPKPPEASYAAPFDSLPLNPVGDQNALHLAVLAKKGLAIDRPTDLQVAAFATEISWWYIRRDPAGFVRRAAVKMIDMWNPTSFLLRHFRFGAYGQVDHRTEALASWCAVVSYLLAMLLGIVGWFCWWRDRRAWLVLLLILFFCGIHAMAFGLTRFRLPLMPFVILLAAHAVWSVGGLLWYSDDGEAPGAAETAQ